MDFVAKCGGLYVIGEAKFFGAYGGNQNNQLRDAMGLVESQASLSSDARAIAVLDGVVWIPNKGFMYKTVSSTEHDVMRFTFARIPRKPSSVNLVSDDA